MIIERKTTRSRFSSLLSCCSNSYNWPRTMTKDRLPALRAAILRRQDSFFDFQPCSEQSAKIPLNSEYKLLIECEYLHDFLREAKIVWNDINWLKSKVEEVKRKQNFILSQPNMNEETRREVDDMISLIKKMAHKVKTKLKEFEMEIERAKEENPTSAKPRIRQMQYDSLSRFYVEVMFECNAIQVEHRERCKERLKRQLEIARRSATTDDQLEEMLEQGNPVIFAEIECINTKEAQIMLADIAARHEAILKVEQSIMELHSMFMDMAILVQNQGEMINQIYHNVMKASDYVATGTKYTKKALKIQKSIRWKKLIIGLVVSAVLIIIIGAVVGSLRKK